MSSQLQQYLARKQEILKNYEKKIIAVRNGEVINSYPSKLAAWKDMQARNLKDGEFVILQCIADNSDHDFIITSNF